MSRRGIEPGFDRQHRHVVAPCLEGQTDRRIAVPGVLDPHQVAEHTFGLAMATRTHPRDVLGACLLTRGEREGIHPTLFYQWQRTFFENGAAAFSSPRTETKGTAAEKKIESLESKLKRKDEVIAEIMEDFIRTKRSLGRAERPLGAS